MELEIVRTLARAALQNLEAHRRRIDDLNVYPVPDGDTGTNLVLTLRSIVEALDDVERRGQRGGREGALARGADGRARQLGRHLLPDRARLRRRPRRVRGREHAPPAPRVPGRERRRVPRGQAAGRGDDADGHPGDGRGGRAEGEPPPRAARASSQTVLARGEDALARTPEMLDVLRDAGVVDAGGAGLVEITRGLALDARGRAAAGRAESRARRWPSTRSTRSSRSTATARCSSSRARASTSRRARGARSSEIGDSLLVVGDASALKVHVHTDEPGPRARGRHGARRRRGGRDREHARADRAARGAADSDVPDALPTLETGLVAVCPGEGNRRLFESLGATKVIEGGQTMNPSTAEIVEAIDATPADEVIVLPNNSNVILTAEQAAELSPKRVRVIPSRSVQAGLAAMGRYISDERGRAERGGHARRPRVGRDRRGDRRVARRGARRREDREGRVPRARRRTRRCGRRRLQERRARGGRARARRRARLARDPHGRGRAAASRSSSRRSNAAHPDVDVEVHDGGQPHYPLLVVAE